MPKLKRFGAALLFQAVFISCSMGCASSDGFITITDEPANSDELTDTDAQATEPDTAEDAGEETRMDAGRPPLVQALSYDDVRPIFTERCSGTSCHSSTNSSRPGLAASNPTVAYEAAREAGRRIAQVIESGEMPFGRRCVVDGEFADPEPEGCLAPQERMRLLNWVAQGAPE